MDKDVRQGFKTNQSALTMADSDNRMTYDGYLRIQDLLSLQDGPQGYMPKPCNNEMHFIVVHQAFELWFKVILREFDEIHKKMSQDVLPEQTIQS